MSILENSLSLFDESDYGKLNYSIWSIEQCQDAQLLNKSSIEDSTAILYNFNNTHILCLEHAPTLTKITIMKSSVLSVLAILSLIGNIITLISVKRGNQNRGRTRPSWTAIYRLIFQLSIADLFVTIFCLAGEALWSILVQWYAGNLACKLFKLLQMFALYLSTFILVLIGVDRWLAVKYPMKSLATESRSSKLVTIAWVISFFLSIPQAIVFRVARGPFVEEFHQCVTHGFYTEQWQEQAYTTLSFVFMFVIPLIILISTYVSTVRTISRSKKFFETENKWQEKYSALDMNRRRLMDRAKMKSLRMSIVIVTAFVIWWTPYYIMMIIFTFWNPEKSVGEDLLSAIFFFGMSNSLVNPVIYGAFHLWPKKKRNYHSESVKTYAQMAASSIAVLIFIRVQVSGRYDEKRNPYRMTRVSVYPSVMANQLGMESGGLRASGRREHTSSVKLTTIRSIRSSSKNCNGQNVTFL